MIIYILQEHERVAIALTKSQRADSVHESTAGKYQIKAHHFMDSQVRVHVRMCVCVCVCVCVHESTAGKHQAQARHCMDSRVYKCMRV